MHNIQHIREWSERDSQTGDWQVRQKLNPDESFLDVIQDSSLKRTFAAWMAGNDNDEALAAVIDVSDDRPGGYRILHHRNPTAMGMPSEGLELYQIDDEPWGRHAEHLQREYSEAKREELTCYMIAQGVDGEERRYHRVIVKRGETLLVASAPFERE